MSNALLVGAKRSANKRPVFVMGPQVGYLYPEFLMEMDLHGGGIDARGVAFPGVSLYVLLGRGKDFSFSATSASGDVVDQFLEELCNPDGSVPTAESTSYMYKGKCTAMGTFTAGVLKGANGEPDQTISYRTTSSPPAASRTPSRSTAPPAAVTCRPRASSKSSTRTRSATRRTS
jgi:penicillin amidase